MTGRRLSTTLRKSTQAHQEPLETLLEMHS